MQDATEFDWQSQVCSWVAGQTWLPDVLPEQATLFFHRAFERTYSPERSWFGAHQGAASLVIGGIFLAAFHRGSVERGVWLLTDNPQVSMRNLRLSPVRSTTRGGKPLTWAHLWPLENFDQVLDSEAIWSSFAQASRRILEFPVSRGREELLRRRGKRPLSEFWRNDGRPSSSRVAVLPDLELEFGATREGRLVWVQHFRRERDPALARRKKTQVRRQLGKLACEICDLQFDDLPAGLGEACCEIHHGHPLGTMVEETETTLADLHVLCANCHRMLHRTEPLKSVAEMRELFRT